MVRVTLGFLSGPHWYPSAPRVSSARPDSLQIHAPTDFPKYRVDTGVVRRRRCRGTLAQTGRQGTPDYMGEGPQAAPSSGSGPGTGSGRRWGAGWDPEQQSGGRAWARGVSPLPLGSWQGPLEGIPSLRGVKINEPFSPPGGAPPQCVASPARRAGCGAHAAGGPPHALQLPGAQPAAARPSLAPRWRPAQRAL